MKRKDFTYSATDRGYMIKYKGQNIGGGGILGPNKGHWSHRRADVKMNGEHARSTIEILLDECGRMDMLKAIQKIDKEGD